jgi:hypothetical protein
MDLSVILTAFSLIAATANGIGMITLYFRYAGMMKNLVQTIRVSDTGKISITGILTDQT